MSNARKIHAEVCGLLLSSLESLQQAHNEFVDLLPPTNIALDLMDNMKIQVTDCHKRLHQLSEMARVSFNFHIILTWKQRQKNYCFLFDAFNEAKIGTIWARLDDT